MWYNRAIKLLDELQETIPQKRDPFHDGLNLDLSLLRARIKQEKRNANENLKSKSGRNADSQ